MNQHFNTKINLTEELALYRLYSKKEKFYGSIMIFWFIVYMFLYGLITYNIIVANCSVLEYLATSYLTGILLAVTIIYSYYLKIFFNMHNNKKSYRGL